jgi:DNA-binding CsgD family transcriptional regulator
MPTDSQRIAQLEQLSDRQREYLLARGKGMSIDKIAESLSVSQGAVKKALSRIYASLELDPALSPTARAQAINRYADLLQAMGGVTGRPGERTSEGAEGEEGHNRDEAEGDPRSMLMVLEDEIELLRGVALVRVEPDPFGLPGDLPGDLPGQRRRRQRLLVSVLGGTLVIGLLLGALLTFLLTLDGQPPEAAATPADILAPLAGPPQAEVPARLIRSEEADPLPEESPAAPSPTTIAAAIPADHISRCGEEEPTQERAEFRFVYSQGLLFFDQESAEEIVPGDWVRSLQITEEGLWIGYADEESGGSGGLSYNEQAGWYNCNFVPGVTGRHINDIEIDQNGFVWVATDGAGISYFDGEGWHTFDQSNGLPTNMVYGLFVDETNQIWAATWEGVALYSEGRWQVPYTVSNNTLANNRVHSVLFDSQQNIWVGHISTGLSVYNNQEGRWTFYRAQTSPLGGDEVRDLLLQTGPEGDLVWIATGDGGITRYQDGEWTRFTTQEGLPHNQVYNLSLDHFGRVWAATEGGVTYYDGNEWLIYHRLPARDVAIGSCRECFMDEEKVWTATAGYGLTFSRLPLPEPVIDVLDVRHPQEVAPGESFLVEIEVAPRVPYQLRQDRGDFLGSLLDSEEERLGAWVHIPVQGTVLPGVPFTFVDYDNPIVAPDLPEGVEAQTITLTWRVWMRTRYVGPPIEVTFTVRR